MQERNARYGYLVALTALALSAMSDVVTINKANADVAPVHQTGGAPNASEILFYPFQENAGAIALDASGIGYTGKVSGCVWVNPGPFNGGAMSFDGVDDYVEVGSAPNFPTWNVYSVSVWFRHNGGGDFGPGYGHKIVDKTSFYHDWKMAVFPDTGVLYVSIIEGNKYLGFSNNDINYVDNKWHHVVFIRNGTLGEFWVDGTLKSSSGGMFSVYSSSKLCIGNSQSSDAFQRKSWSGLLDEVRIFDRVVSSNEVVSLYKDGPYAYTVTFDPQGGTLDPANKVVIFDSAYGDLPAPVRVGYTFRGWQANTNGIIFGVTSNTIVSISTNHTLTAGWTANEHTVTFDPNGGTVDPTNKVVTFDAVYGELPDPSRTGYTFAGWRATTNGVVFGVNSNTVVAVVADHTLTALWNANTYTVTFIAGGGTVSPVEKTVTYGSTYGPLPAPTRNGYVFSGWWTVANGMGSVVVDSTVVTTSADHAIYAAWNEDPYLSNPVDPDELSTISSYEGVLYREEPFGDIQTTVVRGTLNLRLTSLSGMLTAKATIQKGTITFSSKAWTSIDEDGICHSSLEARGGEKLDLYVAQDFIWGTLTGGKVGGAVLSLDGARDRFSDRTDTAAQTLLDSYRGYYTISLPVAAAISSGAAEAAPSGSGYLTLTIGNGGSAKIAGVLADGASVSHSSRLILFEESGPGACVPFFTTPASRKGTAGGLLWIDPQNRTVLTDRYLGWFILWEEPGKGADGFRELLDACGGYYSMPPALEDNYRFSAEINAVNYHYKGGIADLQTAAIPDGIGVPRIDTRLSITSGTSPERVNGAYDYSAENCAMAALSFTSRTGIFRGTFRLYYDYTFNGRLVHKTVTVPYAGVLTPIRSDDFADQPAGQGYYLVPDNNPELKAYRLKRSYPVWLDAAP